jgi:hypothetical protein
MAQLVPFTYCVAIGVMALAVGLFLGIVLRGVRARRQAEQLGGELQKVQQQLSQATGMAQSAIKTPAPVRWTGAEVAAVISAVAALIGGLGTLYVNYQGKALDEKKTDLGAAIELIRYPLPDWKGLEPELIPVNGRNRPQEFWLDHKKASGDCSANKVTLIYAGKNPAVIRCKVGTVTFKLTAPSRLLFVSDTPS